MQELQSHMVDFEGEERDLAINIINFVTKIDNILIGSMEFHIKSHILACC